MKYKLNPKTNKLEEQPIQLWQLLLPLVVLSVMWLGGSVAFFQLMPKTCGNVYCA